MSETIHFAVPRWIVIQPTAHGAALTCVHCRSEKDVFGRNRHELDIEIRSFCLMHKSHKLCSGKTCRCRKAKKKPPLPRQETIADTQSPVERKFLE